jgi:S1-C subfamily serine protease
VEVNGSPIASADDLQLKVENTQVGDTLQLQIRRGDRTQTVQVKTAELRPQAS